MRPVVHMYEFTEQSLAKGSPPLVCIAAVKELRGLVGVSEIDGVFGGHISYRQLPWFTRYVGVWGARNCSRFRRLVRETGGEVIAISERPKGSRVSAWLTKGTRPKLPRAEEGEIDGP